MNVLILNEQQSQLQSIDLDIIKSVTGVYEANEIVAMFKDFFFNKMIIDVTALKNNNIPATYNTLKENINPDKLIFYLPEGSELCTSGFLSRIINVGIYNFTSNIEGIKFLVKRSNTLKDVENILKIAEKDNKKEDTTNNKKNNSEMKNNNIQAIDLGQTPRIIGVKNVTTNAGATSLIYMMKKELSTVYGQRVVAIEVDKTDFLSFKEKNMVSTSSNELKGALNKLNTASIILVDLNECQITEGFSDVIYLMEPSTIKINTLIRKNRGILETLKDKKIVLNKSLLTEKEVSEFESESSLSIFYNMPPVNDRKRNEVIVNFLKNLNLIDVQNNQNSSGKIFGLFRK